MAACQGNLRPCESDVLATDRNTGVYAHVHTHTQTHPPTPIRNGDLWMLQGFAGELPHPKFRSKRMHHREWSVMMNFRIRKLRVKILLSLLRDQLPCTRALSFLNLYWLNFKTGIENSSYSLGCMEIQCGNARGSSIKPSPEKAMIRW